MSTVVERPNQQHTKMRAIAELHTTPENAASAWLATLTQDEKDTFIYPYARLMMRNLMRGVVRQIEHDTEIADQSDRQKLLDEGAFLPDGSWVCWGDMTPADHRARANYLRTMAGGYLRTAEKHDEAAEIIEAAGVECLRDVPQ